MAALMLPTQPSWSAKADHPRVCPQHAGQPSARFPARLRHKPGLAADQLVAGRPSPTMTVGGAGQQWARAGQRGRFNTEVLVKDAEATEKNSVHSAFSVHSVLKPCLAPRRGWPGLRPARTGKKVRGAVP